VLDAHSLEAIAAIDRLIITRQEWHLILFATLGADYGMHFARPTISTTGRYCLLAALPTIRAAAWLVEQSFLLIELLLALRKDEILPALSTL
jgi:hypothetical protein